MKTRILENEIRGKFDLNEIQEIATTKVGENLIIDAPTASGKTEAILLSIEEGSSVTWMLPTITACTFMYRRLCRDFSHLNVRVLTSVLKDERYVTEDATTINIITCDPYMVDYVKFLVEGEEKAFTTDPVLVLDELDNYPTKVRTVLQKYLSIHKGMELKQVIIASATLDADIKNMGFETIKFSHISNKIRYKSFTVSTKKEGVKQILPFYKTHKIGFLCNSISEMEDTMELITRFLKVEQKDLGVIFHHSRLSVEERLENERRLFENDYDILISNDLVSMSVDVELDLLVSSWSDKLNVMIQRFGRLNRRGKKVNYHNLIIMHNECYPPFINDRRAEDLFSKLGFENYESKLITSDVLSDWSEQIELDYVSLEDVLMEVTEMIDQEKEVVLRDIPHVLLYQEDKVFEVRKKGEAISAERKIVTVEMKQQNIPWDRFAPYSQEECEERDLIYVPWLSSVEHPNGKSSNTWIITKTDEEGRMWIEPYTGPKYSEEDDDNYWDEDEEDEDDIVTIEESYEAMLKLLEFSRKWADENDVIIQPQGKYEASEDIDHILKEALGDDKRLVRFFRNNNHSWIYKLEEYIDRFGEGEYISLFSDTFKNLSYLILPTFIKDFYEKFFRKVVREKIGIHYQYDFEIIFPLSGENGLHLEYDEDLRLYREIRKEWANRYADKDIRKYSNMTPIALVADEYTKTMNTPYILISDNESSFYQAHLGFYTKDNKTLDFPIPLEYDILYRTTNCRDIRSEINHIHHDFRDTVDGYCVEMKPNYMFRKLNDERMEYLLKRMESLHKKFITTEFWVKNMHYEAFIYLIEQTLAPANIKYIEFLNELHLYLIEVDNYGVTKLNMDKLPEYLKDFITKRETKSTNKEIRINKELLVLNKSTLEYVLNELKPAVEKEGEIFNLDYFDYSTLEWFPERQRMKELIVGEKFIHKDERYNLISGVEYHNEEKGIRILYEFSEEEIMKDYREYNK